MNEWSPPSSEWNPKAGGGGGGGPLALRAVGTPATSFTAAPHMTLPIPAAVKAGDFLVLVVGHTTLAVTTPAGWTAFPTTPVNTAHKRMYVFHKIASSGDAGSNVQVTATAGNIAIVGVVAAWANPAATPFGTVAAAALTFTTTTLVSASTTLPTGGIRVGFWHVTSASLTTLTVPATSLLAFKGANGALAINTNTTAGSHNMGTLTWSGRQDAQCLTVPLLP